MERRDLLKGAGLLAAAGLANKALADEHEHHHHDHGAMAKGYAGLIDAAGNCVKAGQACLAHCLILLGDGDKTMAGCAKSVNQMLALCGALQNLAAQNSRLTPGLAKLALEACTECEKECKKHADKHAECKACAEACAECSKQCKAVTA